MDYCSFVNVFQGCGEIDLPKPEGIAAKWFFIKAGCGNTSPAASLPFSKISCAPFSGGYPTGYGDHMPNSHSRPAHFSQGKKLLGFAHLQQSGTGAIGYYYNYAVVSPHYADSPDRVTPENESACPGYYCTHLGDIFCELTVTRRLALHRYSFGSTGGKIRIDFSNNGLRIPGNKRAPLEITQITLTDKHTAVCEAVIEGVRLFFAVRCSCELACDEAYAVCACLPDEARIANISLAISAKSAENALSDLDTLNDFDTAKAAAYDEWNNCLGKISIKTDDEKLREIFYSNLYHSLVKPADWSGESFLYDGDKAFMLDLNTLWDMYKTGLPLIFMLCREQGEKITETLMSLCDTLGRMPNSFGLSDEYLLPTEQARMLGAYALMSAYRHGIPVDASRMLSVITTDLFADNKKDFTVDGKCASNTWLLDMADACANAAQIAKEIGDTETEKLLLPYAALWKKAYSAETGLLNTDSIYYEGTLYNYSFRQMVDMDSRIALAGGNESFVTLLDKFFGYGEPDTVQPTDTLNYEPVAEGMKLGRFEGFNNESDTEAPFSYIYAGRHDRTCEIIRAGMKYMFSTGRGGIPGNNDTGALSSYYVFAALGLFPVTGQNLVLIGSPTTDGARVELSSGKILNITVNNNSDDNIYVESVSLNGRELPDFRMTVTELMSGGELIFNMSSKERTEKQ